MFFKDKADVFKDLNGEDIHSATATSRDDSKPLKIGDVMRNGNRHQRRAAMKQIRMMQKRDAKRK